MSPEQKVVEASPIYRMLKVFQSALSKGGALEILDELLDAPGAPMGLLGGVIGLRGAEFRLPVSNRVTKTATYGPSQRGRKSPPRPSPIGGPKTGVR